MIPRAHTAKKRVFVVDDHPLVREWLAVLINQQPDLHVCGDAAAASEALKLISAAKPDVAIVDISMEGGSGLELLKCIKAACPEVAVIILSMHDESIYGERALRAGARGYVMKREATTSVLQAIRCVLGGKLYISENNTGVVTEEPVPGSLSPVASLVELLSDRELEVFDLLGRGYSTRQVAKELRVGFKTVQSFRVRIKEKLKLATATELLREAVRWRDRQRLS